ncbi:MAG TPA: ABC transporter ATP-binding protein [Thermodesulfobacteriota bacterium]|nr:ABC transporter ATP-binding protein [Thermodesulfobacteriota bacterium]
MLEVKNLTKFFGGLGAVRELSFKVEKGQIFGLIGPNGAGKTTVFNLINGFYLPTSGEVLFKGEPITGLKPNAICKKGIARTFQLVKPLSRMTVLENVMASAFCRVNSIKKAQEEALKTLEFCGLMHRKNYLARSLTIGDRKRLEITRAMATHPEVILLDETAAGLNPTELDQAIALIRKIREQGITILIVEHIMKVIMSISDRIHAINYGETITEGTPQEVANNKAVIEAYLGEAYA